VAAVALVIGISQVTDSGADASLEATAHSRTQNQTAVRVTAPDKCPSARRAVIYYGRRLTQWRAKMGVPARTAARQSSAVTSRLGCPRYLAHVLQRKARAARLAYERWYEHEWHWQAWLPDKFARLGACETGYGKRPGLWTWDTRQFDAQGHFVGGYVSAFGIYAPAYEAYHRWTGRNTPREQYEVAAAIQARFGWGAWGCGGA